MATTTAPTVLRGGEWLLQAADADSVFTPERLSDEHRLIGQTAQEFVENEVLPKLDRLEEKDWALARDLVKRSGDLGLLGVFAKVDGEHCPAFLVERAFGVKSGKEEHKMGLHGSSTTPLIFQDVNVPAENVLGEVGKGHKVAFNVLNFARFKLGAMCGGGAIGAISESAKYAATRRQFGQPIASFGAVKHKIGEMVVRTYAI